MANQSFQAHPETPPRKIAFLVFDHHQPLDLAGPLQVFAFANREEAHPRYELVVAAESPGAVLASCAPAILVEHDIDLITDLDTLILPGGPGVEQAIGRKAFMEKVKRGAARARRTCSVCTGAFILAEAGLLAGKRATTHWRSCETLAQNYPGIEVITDPIFVEDGPIWTSAGVTAGMDMALALVEADYGQGLATRIARNLVVYLRRPGGQAQFSEPLLFQERTSQNLYSSLLDQITASPQKDWSIETMADFAKQSPRNFQRRFSAAVGCAPAEAVERVRLARARILLETTGLPLTSIAECCGFGSFERMRRVFQRNLGTTPGAVRELFGRKEKDR